MNKKFAQLAVCFILGIGIQAGAYLYMDRVLFAPLSSGDYDMSDVKDKMAEVVKRKGKNFLLKSASRERPTIPTTISTWPM